MLDSLKKDKNNIILYSALTLYLLVLIWVVIFKFGQPTLILEGGSTVPPYGFRSELNEYIRLPLKDRFVRGFIPWQPTNNSDIITMILDIVTNISVFLPLGLVCASLIKKHNIIYTTLIGFAISFVVEMFQLFTVFGRWDILDLLFNTLGTLLGALLYMLLVKIIPKDKLNITINVFGIVVIFIMIGMLIYAVISIVNAKDIINFKWNIAINHIG